MNNLIKLCLRAFFLIFKVRCQIEFDLKKLPKKGVYVCNHVSYLDPVMLYAFLPGNPVFALNGHLYRRHWIRSLMRYADIELFNPIEPADIKNMISKVDNGRLVVIFAEGRMTENGGKFMKRRDFWPINPRRRLFLCGLMVRNMAISRAQQVNCHIDLCLKLRLRSAHLVPLS